jgi:TolB protein
LYPSLSPDGNYFVYASRAAGNWDIYLQRVGGRNAINLTKDSLLDDTQPAYSPDGQRIAFRSERDGGGIFVMGATGESVKRITDFGYHPAWSPDGREIVCATVNFRTPDYRRSAGSRLFLVNLEATLGPARKRLVGGPEDAVQPAWSPHGHRIAYWGLRGGNRDVWTVPANGGEPVAVTADPHLDWNPVWSPDGRYLYFASDRGGSMNCWRVKIDEESGKLLGAPEPVTTPSSYNGHLSFSRDGGRMCYVQYFLTANLQKVGFDPVRERVLGPPVPVTEGARVAKLPEFSPDGKWLAFYMLGKQQDIFRIRPDGTDLRQLTDDIHVDRMPRWSPDGKRIAFISTRTGKFEIWMMDPDGSGLRQITHESRGPVIAGVWSPEGKRLAYSVHGLGTFVIEVGKPWSEQSPEALSAPNEPDVWFWVRSWSPDGRSLAGDLQRPEGGYSGIAIYSLESRKYRRLTAFGAFARWLRRIFPGRGGGLFPAPA